MYKDQSWRGRQWWWIDVEGEVGWWKSMVA